MPLNQPVPQLVPSSHAGCRSSNEDRANRTIRFWFCGKLYPAATSRPDCPFCSLYYPILRRARNRPIPSDLRAVSKGVKIQKLRKSRTAIWPCPSTQKTSHETRFVLGRHFAKLLDKKVFFLGGRTRARTWDPLIKRHPIRIDFSRKFFQLAKGSALDIPGPEHGENAKDDHREQWSKTKTNRYDPAGIPGGRRL